jgi:cyclophilin family peptidyl-prolyl cis-trans isomerase/HEAT repeat protein
LATAASLSALLLVAAGASSAVPADAVSKATTAIVVAEDQRRFEPLREHLSHADPTVRARALLAVGRLQDSTTVPQVLPLLADPIPAVRREAVFGLGQIGHRSARSAVEERLADRDAETVELAIEALGKLADKAATPKVAGFLADASPRRRAHAAVALWRLADSTALDALLARRRDPDRTVRWRVLYALEKIVAPQRIVMPVAASLDDSDPQVRAQAVRTLGRQKSSLGTQQVARALRDGETDVVVNAIRALQQIADTTWDGWAIEVARRLEHPDPYVRVTAATALLERGPWVAADSTDRIAAETALVTHLKDADAATRGTCARALLVRRGAAALADARAVLADSSIYARTIALRGLPQVGAEAARAELLPRLEPSRPMLERMTAVEVLGELPATEGTRAVLRNALADRVPLFVAAAVGALASLRDTASVPVLARAYAAHAADADADVRISIRDALRELAGGAFADSLELAHPARNAAPRPEAELTAAPSASRAVLHTTAGEVEWEFFVRDAPQTVKNFIALAQRGYFDGTAFHRVVPNFVIQDGDPTGTGSGGPGYAIRCEYNRLRYEPGMVGMALSGKDTGGSQWFVNHSPQPHLDGRYTIFARVTRGMDVVRRIVQGDRVTKITLCSVDCR